MGVIAAGLLLPVALPGHAQDTRTLIRVLNGEADFRVRVQAAFALGNTGNEAMVEPLARALRDQNPAVRAAAATALGRIGSRRALPALRRARRDSSAAVRMQVQSSIQSIRERGGSSSQPTAAPRTRTGSGMYPSIAIVPSEDRIPWSRIRYVAVLGDMGNRTRFGGDSFARKLRNEVGAQLRAQRGIAVMPNARAIDATARRQIERRRLPKFRVDGNVMTVRRSRRGRDLSVRCEVSLMLLDDRQQSLRGEIRGAATGTEPRRRSRDQLQRLADQALEGAVRSAMGNVRQAFHRAARR